MQIIYRSRQSGKTTQIIDAMKNTPDAVLLCANQYECERIVRAHPTLAGRVFEMTTFRIRYQGYVRPHAPIFIDNLDLFLRATFGNVQIISLTEEPLVQPLTTKEQSDDH